MPPAALLNQTYDGGRAHRAVRLQHQCRQRAGARPRHGSKRLIRAWVVDAASSRTIGITRRPPAPARVAIDEDMVENGVADAPTPESLAELAGICPVFRVDRA